MERDRDAVMERATRLVPESLDALTPEERHEIYKMLRLEVLAYPDKSLEVSGAILAGEWEYDGGEPNEVATSDGIGLGVLELTQTS